jgi:hypothetical protein
MAKKPDRITRTAVRKFLLSNPSVEGMHLADLQVYQDIDLAYAVMISRNHLVYEIDMKWEDGQVRIIDMDILVKQSEKPERFQFMGKEFR